MHNDKQALDIRARQVKAERRMTREYTNLTVVTLHQEILVSDRLRGAVLLFILNGEGRVRPCYSTHSPEHRAARRSSWPGG